MSEIEKLIEDARRWPKSYTNPMYLIGSLADAREAAEKAHTPTDDEDILDVIADRLGKHSQARNHEIADSGEYETFLTGPVNVEALAEWLVPTVLRLHRSEVPEPSTEPLLAELSAWKKHTGDTALANLLARAASALSGLHVEKEMWRVREACPHENFTSLHIGRGMVRMTCHDCGDTTEVLSATSHSEIDERSTR